MFFSEFCETTRNINMIFLIMLIFCETTRNINIIKKIFQVCSKLVVKT